MLINLLISPERAEQIVCQALVGTGWHRQFCWKGTEKALWKLLYEAFINLSVFTISKCAAEPQTGTAAQPGERS